MGDHLAPLIQNEHSPKSQCLAQVLGYDMELKPRQVYAEELLKALCPVSSQIADARKNLQRHNTRFSKVELSAMYASLGAVILQSLNATAGSHKPSNQLGQGIQWSIPPSPQLSALSAVMNQTKHALNRALTAKSSDADSLDEEYQVLCRRFAKELVVRQREATATTLARIALKARDPRAGWLHLQHRLQSSNLGLPIHVRGADGALLSDKGESARFWQIHKEKVGISHLKKSGFCQKSLKALLVSD
jgi:hypothetical protein